MGILIGLNEQGECFGQIGHGMRFVLADFVEDFIENGHGLIVLCFGVQDAKRDAAANPTILLAGLMDEFNRHNLFPPVVPDILSVGEYMPDIDFLSVVVDGDNQAIFVASDIEYGEFFHQVGCGECHLQLSEGCVIGFSDDGVPPIQRVPRIRMFPGELDQPLPSNDVHTDIISHNEIDVNEPEKGTELLMFYGSGLSLAAEEE